MKLTDSIRGKTMSARCRAVQLDLRRPWRSSAAASTSSLLVPSKTPSSTWFSFCTASLAMTNTLWRGLDSARRRGRYEGPSCKIKLAASFLKMMRSRLRLKIMVTSCLFRAAWLRSGFLELITSDVFWTRMLPQGLQHDGAGIWKLLQGIQPTPWTVKDFQFLPIAHHGTARLRRTGSKPFSLHES